MKIKIILNLTIWILIVVGIFSWHIFTIEKEKINLAFNTANAFFSQVVVSRAWNAKHGGVYVPITEHTQPNIYLDVENRDIVTNSGIKMTKINPAFMTRQISEIAAKQEKGIKFHITSLKPIRSENKATDWENKWLESFERGAKEQGVFIKEKGALLFRYMAPLYVKKGCLKCHAKQGYQEGDIRGGISVTLPYREKDHTNLIISYLLFAVCGSVFILVGNILYDKKKRLFDATFNHALPTCISDKKFNILKGNDAYWKVFGDKSNVKDIKCYEHRLTKACHTDNCPLVKILDGVDVFVCEPSREIAGKIHHFIVTVKPFFNSKGQIDGIIECFQDITVKKDLELEKESLIVDLKKSLDEVKLLSGFIPICASCKKIRDDKGFWSQVEAYITKHSEAKFSHSICPECAKKLYHELYDQDSINK